MTFPNYSTGTVSVAANGTVVTGSSTIWSGVNARPGDTLQIGDFQTIIADVTDVTHLAIPPWGGGAQSAVTYTIWQNSPLRFAGGQAMQSVNNLVGALNTNGFYVFVDPSLSVPDPSLGNDSQYAFQATTGKLWQKTGGTWNFVGTFKGFGTPAPWSSARAYLPFDVATINGSSYVCILANTNQTPPNATYWTVLASIGNTGPTPLTALSAWTTGTAYVAGPPASYASINGSSYECLIAHTSGTFATDLAAGKWGLVAQVGNNGTNGTNGLSYGGSATTSVVIGTGSKTLAIGTGFAYQISDYVRAKSASNSNNYIEGNVTAYSGGNLTINVTATGGSGTITDWNVSLSAAASSIPLGALVNSATSINTTAFSTTAAILVGGSVPQNTQGAQIATVTITPKTVTNKLRVRWSCMLAPSAADNIVVAMFVNSVANAVTARYSSTASGFQQLMMLEYEFVPGVTTATTIAVRAGSGSGSATITGMNSSLGSGINVGIIVVEEIAA